MTGFAFAYAVVRVCGGQPRKNPGAPPWKSMELHPDILSFATSAVAKVRIITGTKECFRYFFIRCSIKKKSCPEKFRFKFMDAYIHIRSKLNPSCDSGTFD